MTSLLIVDDSRAARMMMKHFVKAIWPDYTIMEAGNAEEALQVAVKLTADDYAILDYNMPGLTGVELATRLLAKLEANRIALVTANIQTAVRERAKELGLHYMTKPINPAKIKSLLGQMESSA